MTLIRSTLASPSSGRDRLRTAMAVVGAWFAVGLLSASQYYLAARSLGQPGAWAEQLLRELPPWQVWSVLTPLAFRLARSFSLIPGRLLRHVPIHLAASIACAFVYLMTYALWMRLTLPSYAEQPFPNLFTAIFRARFNVAVILYWGLVGVHHALWSFRQLREREIETARVQAESARARADAADARAGLARARLQVLQSQLHPHFLFNTLHSIAALVDEDAPTARRLIARLSDLLRTTLEIGEAAHVALGDELAFLERYLDIERVRFGSRLTVVWEIAPEARSARVPPLLLQPLVENAVRHGVGPLEEGGVISIGARVEGERLSLEIADDGRGIPASDLPPEGNGLRITRERLRHAYGRDQELLLDRGSGGGLAVRIRVPLRPADSEDGGA